MQHKQVLANLIKFKVVKFEEIDSLINMLGDKRIRQLIIELKTKDRNTMFVVIEHSWQGELMLYVKRKFRMDAELFIAHIAAWLIKLHSDSILSKLYPDMPKVAKEIG